MRELKKSELFNISAAESSKCDMAIIGGGIIVPTLSMFGAFIGSGLGGLLGAAGAYDSVALGIATGALIGFTVTAMPLAVYFMGLTILACPHEGKA